MSRNHTDIANCRKLPGVAIGKLCDKCDGRCITCDSYFRPYVQVHICDECNYGSLQNTCIICGASGAKSDAYYCKSCVLLQKDRDGCPKILVTSANKKDLFYEKRKSNRAPTLQ